MKEELRTPVDIDKKFNIKDIVQTITTKQDRHPNSGNIYFNPKNDKSRYRFLTPRECFLLMGFDEKDFDIFAEFVKKHPDMEIIEMQKFK